MFGYGLITFGDDMDLPIVIFVEKDIRCTGALRRIFRSSISQIFLRDFGLTFRTLYFISISLVFFRHLGRLFGLL